MKKKIWQKIWFFGHIYKLNTSSQHKHDLKFFACPQKSKWIKWPIFTIFHQLILIAVWYYLQGNCFFLTTRAFRFIPYNVIFIYIYRSYCIFSSFGMIDHLYVGRFERNLNLFFLHFFNIQYYISYYY